jgi:predicted Fe-Mo cluster-binding NifX family protein
LRKHANNIEAMEALVMKVLVPVTADGQVDERFGRAPRVAIFAIEDGAVADSQVHEVGWDVLHDTGGEGAHHARVARFLIDEGVGAIAAGHMGPGMQHMLGRMEIRVLLDASGDAAAAALAAASDAQAAG